MTSPIRVVLTVASLAAEHGGPSRSVTSLGAALAQRGVVVELVTSAPGPSEAPPVLPPEGLVPVRFARRPSARDALGGNSDLARALRTVLGQGSILHDTGLWLPSNHVAAAVARRTSVPFVVSVRGMASAWALRQGRVKKRLAWALYQRRDLRTARLLHATAQAEVEDLRRLGLRQPVAVVPNGVDVPAVARHDWGERPARRALFLSRIHPGKGLINLVRAWAQTRPMGWELVIAGPDADGHRAEVERLARELGVGEAIRFAGPIEDGEKWDLYRSADLFVLPTFSENFGIVVAEALAAGVPAITTKGAPWQDLETHRCGWWIDVGVEPLAAALGEATALTDARREAMGRRGRALVEQRYSWDHAAEAMAAAYAWLLGRGERPACVVS